MGIVTNGCRHAGHESMQQLAGACRSASAHVLLLKHKDDSSTLCHRWLPQTDASFGSRSSAGCRSTGLSPTTTSSKKRYGR